MTPERWQQIEELYHHALELPAAERTDLLAEIGANDPTLRREIEVLLAANHRAGNFINEPAFVRAAGLLGTQHAAPLVGQTLSHYEVLAPIGAGGMGEVFLARDTRLGRQVALKLLPPQFTQDAGRLQRFLREAKTASALNHPNIITIHEIGEWEQTFFIVTEYIAGVTLRQRLAERRLSLGEALNITRQIAAALEAAHAAGITHRDIKPENVMLRPDGLVKVLDFGLARFIERRQESGEVQPSNQTDTGMVLGTPRYMSPEQARGLKVDARSDIFSLGVVLYEMVSGAPPFNGATSAEVFAALLEKEPAPLVEYLPEAPEELEEIVRRALEKDRAERYQAICDFASELELLKHQIEVAAEAIGTRSPAASSKASAARRNARVSRHTAQREPRAMPVSRLFGVSQQRALWLSAALVLLAGLGVGFYQLSDWMKWSRPSEPMTTVPFVTYDGQKDYACFSPDGSQIAFAWDGGKKERQGNRNIYIKLIGVGDPVQMTFASEDESRPAWSPDNKYLAFLRRGAVYVIPSLPGGAERRLGEAGEGLSWSPDSKTLALASLYKKDSPSNILLISAETGERLKQLTFPPNYDDQPAFSPDGKWMAFFRSFGATQRELFVMPAGGGEPKQLTFDKRQTFGLAWTGDSREIVYATNRGGGMGLWRIRASGGTPERITVGSLNPTRPAISRLGNRLAYTDVYADSNIYLYQGAGFVGRPAPEKLGDPVALLSSSRDDHSQQFSPDGEKIVFASVRTGSDELWVCQRDGTKLKQLTNFDGYPTGTPRWSPDGRWIAFDTRVTGNAEVFIINVEGGAPRNFTNAPSFEGLPSWSHDGQWIYFSSNRTGSAEIWKQPVAGGEAVQFTHAAGQAIEGFESADGKLFYFLKNSEGRYGIWSIPATGGEEKPVPELSQVGSWRSWGLLAQGIYFIAREETPRPTVKFFSFVTHQITPLVTVERPPLYNLPGLALSPDGRSLLYAQKDHGVNDIMLIENFN